MLRCDKDQEFKHFVYSILVSSPVLWSVAVDVAVLVTDPASTMAAAFVSSKQNTTHCKNCR